MIKKILLIEDEVPIRRVLSKILTEENKNYILTEAEDGKSGLIQLSKTNFDLVLCDIKMPKMDGIEVLKKLKKKILMFHLSCLQVMEILKPL